MASERVVWGIPGSGKTEFGTRLARIWAARGVKNKEIAYLAFTKAAAKAAAMKILDSEDDAKLAEAFPYFRTIHSLSYLGLRKSRPHIKMINEGHMKAFGKVSGMDGAYGIYEWEHDLGEVFQRVNKGGRTDYDVALSAYTMTRLSATSRADLEIARIQPSRKAMSVLGIENMESNVYQTFVSQYERFKKAEEVIDFTDMLEFALFDMPPLDCRYFIIDEAQDLCPLHYAIISKLSSNAEEIFWIGDDDQCQPAGTKVWLSKDGASKDISEVQQGDEVLSFDRPGAALSPSKKVLKTACRPYTGNLFSVKAGGRVTRCTDNHRFIGRWTPEARGGKECVTYLMERDGRWRVGWCQLFNSEKALHFNVRMNHERAKQGWILKVHSDRTEASVHESVVAARYGIPTCTFEPVNGAHHLTSEAIDRLFKEIGDRSAQAAQCLLDHGRDVKYPFVDKVSAMGKKRTTLFETQACNLIPDLMTVPVVQDGAYTWEPIQVSVEPVEDLPVYSLKIERHETYVADGIVTHNSIYQWSGASADLFLDRARLARYHIQLRQTHRYGQEIVDFSGQIIRRVARRHDKQILGVKGKEGRVIHSGEFTPEPGNLLILNRHVAGCEAIAGAYIEAGLPFRNERGRDPLDSYNRVKSWETLNSLSKGDTVSMSNAASMIDTLMKSVVQGDHKKKVRLVVHGAKAKFENLGNEHVGLYDLVKGSILTQEGMNVISEREYWTLNHSQDLEYYDRVTKKGYSLDADAKNIPRITTIHGSKGRQAERVIGFSEMSNTCWEDPDSEHRLAYVLATRTQTDLTICRQSMVDWARSEYNYPFKDDEK